MQSNPQTGRSVMIMVAPNGARRTKIDHPALPMSASELADEARRCLDAGASAIHLHVRGDDGTHVLDAARYRAATEAVTAATGGTMAVQITTEAVGRYEPAEQMAVVREAMPQAVSVAVRELVPDAAGEEAAAAFFHWLMETRISPQFILYDAGDVARFFDLRDRGVIPFSNPFLLFVLGRYAADQQSSPGDLDPFLDALQGRDAVWAVCAFGRRECACAEAAIAAGGHVRVGFENNLHLPDGGLADTNADLVACVARAARSMGYALMDGQETEALLAAVAT